MNIDYSILHYRSVVNEFSNQFFNEQFSDCVLKAEGKSIRVHKAVLCAQSSFLEKMILEHIHVADLYFVVEGVLYEDLKSVMQFTYNGLVKMDKSNFGSFLVVAELLGMKWVDHIQIRPEDERSEIEMLKQNSNGSKNNELNIKTRQKIGKTPLLVLKDITNIVAKKVTKRKRFINNKKHSKKLQFVRNDCVDKKRINEINTAESIQEFNTRAGEIMPTGTDLAKMDQNTFCSTLGLKKNTEPRELVAKPDECPSANIQKPSRKTKIVPPLLKINPNQVSESYESRESEMFVSEINNVFIEDKNLSFLSVCANELCVRENNIEIECDVLEASSQFVLCEKENSIGNIVELQEGNIIEAEFLNVNSENTPDCKISKKKKTPRNSKKSGGRKSVTIDKSCCDGSTLFWCDMCQRTYHTKTGLNQHKRYECCKEPTFVCPRCEKRFKRKSSLVRHAITLHDEAVFPTRTKLLSKLTSPEDRNILTISGKR